MAGILNLPLRLAFRDHGWDVTCIGSVDARAVAQSGDGRIIDILGREERTSSDDTPLIIQLMGCDAEDMIRALSLLEDRADAFDVNLGCPLKLATSRGMGIALMERPELALSIMKRLAAASAKPLTAKIRLLPSGDRQDMRGFAQRAEEAGISALIVHARTPYQGFDGAADQDTIRAIRERLSIPVVYSGGVRSVGDILSCRERTGCDAIMVSTGALADPFLAEAYREQISGAAVSPAGSFGRVRDFAGDYARRACLLRGVSRHSPFYYRSLLHFFVLRARTRLFVRRHSPRRERRGPGPTL